MVYNIGKRRLHESIDIEAQIPDSEYNKLGGDYYFEIYKDGEYVGYEDGYGYGSPNALTWCKKDARELVDEHTSTAVFEIFRNSEPELIIYYKSKKPKKENYTSDKTMRRRLMESISARDVLDFDILQIIKYHAIETAITQYPGVYVSELNYVNDRFTEDEYLKAAKFYSSLFDVYEAKYGYFGDKDYLILEKGVSINYYVDRFNIDFPDDNFTLSVDDFKKIS